MAVFPVSLAKYTGVTRLYDDYVNGRMAGLLGGNFYDIAKITQTAGQIDRHSYPRNELVKILRQSNLDLGAKELSLNNIERLGDPQSLCVFAGQQTGIFLGPIYTIYKALATVKLASHYQKLLNRPVIPCFWMATDDHDFAEISSVGFLGRGGESLKLSYDSPDASANLPIADVKYDDNILAVLDQLEQTMLDTEFKKPLLNYIKETHKPGVPIAESFARLFNHLIGDYGIVLVDPNFPGLKQHFKKIFAYEIENHQQTFSAFDKQSKWLIESGYHAQIHKTGELLNLFYHNPKRSNLSLTGESYRVGDSDQKYSQTKLMQMVQDHPDLFSPNALLRPIAQAAAFPTLCQITGPSELAYYAQIAPLFELFDVPLPIIFPRPGMTIIEPQAKRIVDKYQLNIGQMKNNIEQVIGELINRLFPSDAASEANLIRENVREHLTALGNSLKQADPDSFQIAANFQKKIDFDFGELQKKLKAANKKRHDDLTIQIRKTRDFIFPENTLQERVISPVYYANKFGPKIFDEIYKTLDIEQANHMVMEV
jgi:bacillithiol biosynthesis cysteine-adding enzyme BshC